MTATSRRSVRPIVLIGAARSGTKIARDVLAEATDAGRVPYDVGFVWRYGNEAVRHDVLDPMSVTPGMARFIRAYLERYSHGHSIVVEKTVGNALRVPFVHRVVPNAAFVHLIRDGVDVAESTRRQWRAPIDRSYLAQKARHFPVRLLPTYGRKYAASQLRRYIRADSRVSTWGPRYRGIEDDVRSDDLLTVCAKQWQTCVEQAQEDLEGLDAPIATLRYEDLVDDAEGALSKLLTQLAIHADESDVRRAASRIESGHLGTGARRLTAPELESLDAQLGSTLSRFGYRPAVSREVDRHA